MSIANLNHPTSPSSFTTLSEDLKRLIVRKLDAESLANLLLTGNKLWVDICSQHCFTHSNTSFTFVSKRSFQYINQEIERLASKIHQICLSFEAFQDPCLYTDEELKKIKSLHDGLIENINKCSLLRDLELTNSPFLTNTHIQQFLNLQTLIIKNCPHLSLKVELPSTLISLHIDQAILTFPPYLTSLEIASAAKVSNRCVIKDLPKSLTTLRLAGLFDFQKDDFSKGPEQLSVWPEHLSVLDLASVSFPGGDLLYGRRPNIQEIFGINFLQSLPPTLSSLGLAELDFNMIPLLPKTLTTLTLSDTALSTEDFKELPNSLTYLNIHQVQNPRAEEFTFPQCLKTFKVGVISRFPSSLPKSLSSLILKFINWVMPKSLPFLPQNLTTFTIGSEWEFSEDDLKKIPSSVQKLTLCPTISTLAEKKFTLFPRNLTALHLREISLEVTENDLLTLPPKLTSLKINLCTQSQVFSSQWFANLPRSLINLQILNAESFKGLEKSYTKARPLLLNEKSRKQLSKMCNTK